MISDADFAEVFPIMTRTAACAASSSEPSDVCIARWEDDGGRVEVRPEQPTLAVVQARAWRRKPGRATIATPLHILPALTICIAALALAAASDFANAVGGKP